MTEHELLERELELATLLATLEEAHAGNGNLALIEGEAGIGKSSLLDLFAEEAVRRGCRVLRARAAELEREFAHGVCRQLLEEHIRAMSAERRGRLLQGAAQPAASILDLAASDSGRAPDPLAANHALFWVASGLADESTLVLTIDDAHWADEISLRWVHYLGRRLEGLRMVVVLALRPAEPGSPLELLNAIRHLDDVVEVRPRALSEAATRTALGRLMARPVDAEFSRACRELTGGNPFLLRELARALADNDTTAAVSASKLGRLGSRSVSRRVLGRLGSLMPEGLALAQAVAVLEIDSELAHAAAVAELNKDAAHRAADALVEAAILERGPCLRFVHPMVRRAVYEDIGEGRRSMLHRRAADVLICAGLAAERAAVHLLHAAPGGDAYVVEHLRAVAARASARGAPEAAVPLLRRALVEPPPPSEGAEVLLELGRALHALGDAEAVTCLEDALAASDSPTLRASIVGELAAALGIFGDVDRAADMLLAARGELGPSERERRLELEAVYLAVCAAVEPLAAGAVERLPTLLREATGETPAERVLLAAASHHRVFNAIGTAEDTAELALRALSHRWEPAEPLTSTMLWLGPGVALIFADHSTEAEALIDSAEADAAQRGSPTTFLCAQVLRSRLALARGALAEVEEAGRTVLDASDVLGPIVRDWVLALVVHALVEMGRAEDADRLLEEHDLLTGDLPPTSSAHMLVLARAALHRTRGRLELAMADVEDSLARQALRGGVFVKPLAAASRALTLHAAGETERAVAEARADLEAYERCGPAGATGWAHLVLARVTTGEPEALEHLRQAVELLRETPRRLDHAHALVDLGAALRRNRRRLEARDPLRLGLHLARRCGAVPLAERAKVELEATGARPRRLVLSGLDALTPSERRVAELAAGGRTNREIAQALFVTRKTVETHLRHTYMKLEVRSREELRDALRGGQREVPRA